MNVTRANKQTNKQQTNKLVCLFVCLTRERRARVGAVRSSTRANLYRFFGALLAQVGIFFGVEANFDKANLCSHVCWLNGLY